MRNKFNKIVKIKKSIIKYFKINKFCLYFVINPVELFRKKMVRIS